MVSLPLAENNRAGRQRAARRETMMVPEMRGARGFIHPGDRCRLRLCSVVGELGEKARPSSGEGEERQGPREKGMERREECKDRENPGKQHRWPGATQQMGGSSPPTCAAPGEEVPPRYPGNFFFALGGGSAEAVAGSKFRVGGKHKGVCSQSWVASPGSGRGKETLSELQEPVGERCC